MKRGSRAGRRRLVVHARVAPSPSASSTRAGFVVSKAVGNSVVRHRVSRRLRHLVAARLGTVPPGSALVIRALPPAATASSAELGADLDTALRRLGLLPDRRTAGSGQDDKDGPAV
ncbi:ribonuclease P protein component [Amycolatopsis bartoniae]|nr:ribonuclease P protein component [Amycolatopsis bartoniae]